MAASSLVVVAVDSLEDIFDHQEAYCNNEEGTNEEDSILMMVHIAYWDDVNTRKKPLEVDSCFLKDLVLSHNSEVDSDNLNFHFL